MRLTKLGVGYGEAMAKPLVTAELWEAIKPLLPEESPKPKKGGTAGRASRDRAALTGILLFVLKSGGIPWEMPGEVGCGSGMTSCWRRLKEWEGAGGVWGRLHRVILAIASGKPARRSTGSGGRRWNRQASPPPPGGRRERPEPHRQGQEGLTKAPSRGRAAAGGCLPLSVIHTAANAVHDSKALLEEAVEETPYLQSAAVLVAGPAGRPGRPPRKRPKKLLHADKGYDYPRCRKALKVRGDCPKHRSARRRVEREAGTAPMGRREADAVSWLNRFRGLKVRYERRADIHQAFLNVGCALICWRYVQRFC